MKKEKPKINYPTETLQEGKVKFLVPKLKAFITKPSEYAPSKAPVFYNPIMELNRDIGVIALQAYWKNFNCNLSICEPLTGCGVRGIRYAKEVEGVEKVLINDINRKAFELAKYNVKINRLSRKVKVVNSDANLLLAMYRAPGKRFDFIDLDPFGSPVPFLESAIRALRSGGLIALTATDMAPLCGVYPKACIRRYQAKPLRTEYCHELAVRLLAGCLATTAAKHDIGVQILFSHSTDHYIRVYARIEHGAKKADESIGKLGRIHHCFKCFHRHVEKGFFTDIYGQCPECGSKTDFAGPLWLDKIFDDKFCEIMIKESCNFKLKNSKRIKKILTLIRGEVEAPTAYYVLDVICDRLAIQVPPLNRVFEALEKEGFRAFKTHFNPKGLKTEASASTLTKKLMELCRKKL
ncbi:MAG: tRNA (guanine(10)-N(2))-dimethyltransferase [Candidatus Bathyarchaeia archaeon]